MNNVANFDVVLSPPMETEGAGRIEMIRRTSNVIQALENVVTQCEDSPEFEAMRESIQDFLWFTRVKMQQLIHR